MEYTDFKFYKTVYMGTKIPDVTQFNQNVTEATAYVDNMIMNRDNLNFPAIFEKYNKAVCAVADAIYSSVTEPKKQSESVGNHSVSYVVKSAEDYEKEKRSKALIYLSQTGLLYCAI